MTAIELHWKQYWERVVWENWIKAKKEKQEEINKYTNITDCFIFWQELEDGVK